MQKAIRIIAVVLVLGFLGYLIVAGAISNEKAQKEPWVPAMTLGDRETAEHVFYDYTDIMCPFCNKFAIAMAVHIDDFQKDYVEGKKVYYELRLTDLLAKFHPESESTVNNSHLSARAGYCAADKDKFWDWYDWILAKLMMDYYQYDVGTAPGKEPIPKLDPEYFTKVDDMIEGLDNDYMASCINSDEIVAKVNKYTKKASSTVRGGLPYYSFNNQTFTGFDGNWDVEHDWTQAKLMFDAGIAGKK